MNAIPLKQLIKKQRCDDKERAKNKYIELSEEDKNIKREYGRTGQKNMSKEDKEKLKEYQKNYRDPKKSRKS